MDIFLQTAFRPLCGAAISNFYTLTDWPRLPSLSTNGDGGPPKNFNRENLKFGLKLSVWSSITSGLVGISSPKLSRRRGEVWPINERGMGTNIDTADVHVHCKLTQFHMPRGSRARFSGSFGSWRCCERNFKYLNWLSTRICGAGWPHVWLCHALLLDSTVRMGVHLIQLTTWQWSNAVTPPTRCSWRHIRRRVKLLFGGAWVTGSGGLPSPSGVQGRSPGGGLGANTPEAEI